jgi:hypothetical protein
MGNCGRFSSVLAPTNTIRVTLLEDYALREKYNITCTQLPPSAQADAGAAAAVAGAAVAGETGAAAAAAVGAAEAGGSVPGEMGAAADSEGSDGTGRPAGAGAAIGEEAAAAVGEQSAGTAGGGGNDPDPLFLLPAVSPPCVGWRVTRCTCPALHHVTLREVLLARRSGKSQVFRVWARISK